MAKRILFLTGTRADFGKLKSLIEVLLPDEQFDVDIFATGMHLDKRYGYTVNEIEKCGYPSIYKYINFGHETPMDIILAHTIEGLSNYIRQERPDLIVVHGDRVETLAGAIGGALNNVRVAHIEGGEVSGTVDESLRHSISKLSHVHFVSNEEARQRLVQMGEDPETVFPIGSPDIDIMFSGSLPTLDEVKTYYEIPYDEYGILMFHPVTTDVDNLRTYADNLVAAINAQDLPFVGIFPNNDEGTHYIQEAFDEGFVGNDRVQFFPSLRFENFLVLLKHARMLVGNSSAGIREAPYYGIPSVDIGNRQNNRGKAASIISCGYTQDEMSIALQQAAALGPMAPTRDFGAGDSDSQFLDILRSDAFWGRPIQKAFIDLG